MNKWLWLYICFRYVYVHLCINCRAQKYSFSICQDRLVKSSCSAARPEGSTKIHRVNIPWGPVPVVKCKKKYHKISRDAPNSISHVWSCHLQCRCFAMLQMKPGLRRKEWRIQSQKLQSCAAGTARNSGICWRSSWRPRPRPLLRSAAKRPPAISPGWQLHQWRSGCKAGRLDSNHVVCTWSHFHGDIEREIYLCTNHQTSVFKMWLENMLAVLWVANETSKVWASQT